MRVVLSLLTVGTLGSTACAASAGDPATATAERPTVVATTSILGDLVRNVVGDEADVDVFVPVGVDPHEFAPSIRQAESLLEADLLVVNGADLEHGLDDLVERARDAGTPIFALAEQVPLRPATGGGTDPHVWTDPSTVARAVEQLGAVLPELVPDVDAGTVAERAGAYAERLRALDREIERILAPIPPERRVLVTSHDSFGYFADRHGLRVVGTVIPSRTTSAGASAGALEALAEIIEHERVPAIFVEATESAALADALAGDVDGDVAVVELLTESLGAPGSGADTYVGMIRTDAERIAEALS